MIMADNSTSRPPFDNMKQTSAGSVEVKQEKQDSSSVPGALPPPPGVTTQDRDHKHHSSSRHSSHRDDKDRGRSSRHHNDKDSRSRRRSRSKSRDKDNEIARPPSPPRKRRVVQSLWDAPPTGVESLLMPASNMALQRARKLYVGNIPPIMTEDELLELVNAAMVAANLNTSASKPALTVQINYEKAYGFMDFRTAEEATAAMTLDGIQVHGQPLRFRRPKDWTPQDSGTDTTPAVIQPGVGKHIISSNVADTPNKIYIGGIPTYLTSDQVMEFLQTFGQLRSFDLVKDLATGESKGFAFCEFMDESLTDKACTGLHGMKLGNKTLLVQRASVGSKKPPLISPSAVALMPGVSTPQSPSINSFLNLAIPAVTIFTNLIQANDENTPPTNVIMLCNMFLSDDLRDDNFYLDMVEDVRDECNLYGKVLNIHIPRQLFGKAAPPGLGKVFVQYSTLEEAIAAHEGLGGQRFNNREIISTYCNVEAFDELLKLPPPEPEKTLTIAEQQQKKLESEYDKLLQETEAVFAEAQP